MGKRNFAMPHNVQRLISTKSFGVLEPAETLCGARLSNHAIMCSLPACNLGQQKLIIPFHFLAKTGVGRPGEPRPRVRALHELIFLNNFRLVELNKK